jgi:hypothetical protein
LSHLAGQLIEKILNRAFPVFCPVEDDRSVHGCMLTHMLTFVKVILATLLSWVLPAAFCPTIRKPDRKLTETRPPISRK